MIRQTKIIRVRICPFERFCGTLTGENSIFQKLSETYPRDVDPLEEHIGDILIRAKFSTRRRSKRTNNGYTICNRLCKACALSGLKRGEKITSHKCKRSGKEWKITSPLNCQSTNVIYKITCKKCPFIYIGETQRKFCERLTEHRGYVTKKQLNQPVGLHFSQKGHSIEDMIAIAIEKVMPLGDHLLRKCREKYWINNCDSVSFGANKRDQK